MERPDLTNKIASASPSFTLQDRHNRLHRPALERLCLAGRSAYVWEPVTAEGP